MDNVEVSKSTKYKIYMQQRTETEVRSGYRKYCTHDAMHPSCTALLIGSSGWPQQFQRKSKEMHGEMEGTICMTR